MAFQMPPPDSNLSLSNEEKNLLDKWIASGAAFDKHWSFKNLPAKVDVPRAGDSWARNEIDRFVTRKLDREGVSPKREAEKTTLLRRVTFALTGLPPTPEEIDAFLENESPTAYEDAVDRLLSSSHYGERMAVNWLDLARYADTFGYQQDKYRAVWPWRDWVVQSFNRNMPFDQFVVWQLAGDLLKNPTREQKLATAFNRLHRQTNEGGSIEEEFRTEYVVDRVDTFGAAFLGLTVGCARCHDHKYDPLPQKEYYQLFAYFNNIDESGLYSYFTSAMPTPTLDLATPDQAKRLKQLEQQLREAESRVAEVRKERQSTFHSWLQSAADSPFPLTGLIGDFTWDEPKLGQPIANGVEGGESRCVLRCTTLGGGQTR